MSDWELFLCPYLDPDLVDSNWPQNLKLDNYGNSGSLKLFAGPMYAPDIQMSEGGKDAETVASREACTVEIGI